MTHIFLSDVHLGAFNKEKNQHLEKELHLLIDYCESREIQIHILGDFFDYWMEFPDFIPELGRLLLDRFEQYNQVMGNKTTYITGNHDYWTVSHFKERGFRVEHEYVELKLDDELVFLCHGDGLSGEQFQLPRPLLHRFLRDDRFIRLYKSVLPGKAGLHLMKSFSSFTKDEDIEPERLSKWAEYMLKNFSYDTIITGHDHVARKETFPGGIYINTGAFYKHKTVLKYNKGAYDLVTWNGSTKEFKPYLKLLNKSDLNEQ